MAYRRIILVGSLVLFPIALRKVIEHLPAGVFLNPTNYTSLIVTMYVVIAVVALVFAWLLPPMIAPYEKRLTKILRVLLIVYIVYLFVMTLVRYYNFSSQVIDLSYYHHVVWQLAEFKVPRIWDIPQRFVWGDHFEPILFLLVPLYWLKKDAAILMIAQVGVVLSGVIPLILILKHHLKHEVLAYVVSFAYVLFSGLQMGYAYGFHPIVFFPTLFFWTYYSLIKRKHWWYFVFLILSLCIKEEVAFTVLFLGIFLVLMKKQWKLGLATVVVGLLWYVLCFRIIFPTFNQGAGFGHWGQYGELGKDGVVGLIKNALVHPLLFLKALITPSDKIETMFHSFGAFAFLPFLYPPSFIVIIPSLLEKLLSGDIARLNGFHYSAVIAGVTAVASIESLSSFVKTYGTKKSFIQNQLFWSVFILYTSFVVYFFFGYKPLTFSSSLKEIFTSKEDVHTVYKILDGLPPTASVSAQYQIAPHVNRPMGKILPAPHTGENSDYVIVDLNLPLVLTTARDFKNYLGSLIEGKRYQLVFAEEKVFVFKKKSLNKKL